MVIPSGRRDLEMEMMKNSPPLVLPLKKRTWTSWEALKMLAHVTSLELERREKEEEELAMKKKKMTVDVPPALVPLMVHDREEEEEAIKKKKNDVPALPFSGKKKMDDVPPALMPLTLHDHAEEEEATKKKNDHPALLLSCKKKRMDHDDDSSKKAMKKKRKKMGDDDDSPKKAMEKKKKKRRTKKAQYDSEPAPHGWLEAHHRMMVANKDPGLIDVFRKTLESSDVSSHLNRFYLPKEKVREILLPGLGFSQDVEVGALKEGMDVVGLDDMGRQWNLRWTYWSGRYHILDG